MVLVVSLLTKDEYEQLSKRTPIGSELFAHWIPRRAVSDTMLARMAGDNLATMLVRAVKVGLLNAAGGVIRGGKDLQ